MIEKPEGTYDAIVIAVGHDEYKALSTSDLRAMSNGKLLLFDIKGIKDKTVMSFIGGFDFQILA